MIYVAKLSLLGYRIVSKFPLSHCRYEMGLVGWHVLGTEIPPEPFQIWDGPCGLACVGHGNLHALPALASSPRPWARTRHIFLHVPDLTHGEPCRVMCLECAVSGVSMGRPAHLPALCMYMCMDCCKWAAITENLNKLSVKDNNPIIYSTYLWIMIFSL